MSREVFARAHNSVETLHEFLLLGARLTPDKAAVVEFAGNEAGTISYRQLQRRVEECVRTLGELGLDMGDRIILESNTSPSAIATFLACSSLGLPFVPVSPEIPAQRLLSIIEATGPALYLQPDDGRRDGIPAEVGTGRFGPDGVTIDRAPQPRGQFRREIVSADPAYMVFTSGTTGRPKGVVMSHRGILAFYRGMLQHGIVGPESRVATTSPFHFDFSLLDIGLALGSGATVVPVPRPLLRWPRRFVKFLRDTGATQVNGVPSIWRSVLKHEPEQLGELGEQIRGVLFSGEPFPLPELRQLQGLLPAARIVNCFGSTESVASSFTDVPRPIPADMERLSIGFAHPGAEMMLLDDDNRHVAEPGVVGNIYLRSSALFTAYWGDPAATAKALVPDPTNPLTGQTVYRTGDLAYRGEGGELYFVGRADSLVKIRGNRVELAEVERRVAQFPGVAAACALLLPADVDPALAVFVVLAQDVESVDELELAAFCMEALPDYMVPREIRVLDELPVTVNGKVDRAALAEVVA
ncbi:AMP-binding protein [Kibdelosporangium persicum]|uniref:Dimodular nonribosomal peptide synthase n=1 Tax=Kibdelosporangium persicum TaxID=2698649 RepID=A0ABX2F5E1_9PSEU|nr:AMP-binding protein [Kibdelosporangium persicum]NRN66559.1 Dimodular nonribosomal peptide synthase [Kibdelosporangium persicum]